MNWQNLEERVREIASIKWGCPATPRDINGVRVDAVVEWKPDYWILIETTKQSSLDKLRTDVAKFATVKPLLFSKGIYTECFFITENDPPPSLITSGTGQNVTVLSAHGFQEHFFRYQTYARERLDKPFGSAIDPESGRKDTHRYIPVQYRHVDSHKPARLADIAGLLKQQKRLVLTGNYGTGKSRCVQELFQALQTAPTESGLFPLAIDLRHNWGVRRGTELIRRHFDDMGQSDLADFALRLVGTGRLILLIDGFDEIGSQSWSDDPAKLRDIRRRSLDLKPVFPDGRFGVSA